jgi:hypothetical protein
MYDRLTRCDTETVKFKLRAYLLLPQYLRAAHPSSLTRNRETDGIVPLDAKLERVAAGFSKLPEESVWTLVGSLLLAEIPANNIDIWILG